MSYRTTAALTILVGTMGLAAEQRGAITKVTPSAAVVVAGQTVSFTEDGTNPCGAANLNYGDGVVITYPITGLPAQQTHSYDKAGTYTVIARGMGNCDGEATTTVQVKRAVVTQEPEPPKGPHITAVEFAPAVGITRQPLTIIVSGAGTCRFTASYGDGNSQEFKVELPYRFQHTYALGGTFTVIVAPVAPCTGKFTNRVNVATRIGVARVLGVTFAPLRGWAGEPVTITVDGAGTCGYAIDFGDGNSDARNAALPDPVRHNYPAPGDYVISVAPTAPCIGSARRVLQVRGR